MGSLLKNNLIDELIVNLNLGEASNTIKIEEFEQPELPQKDKVKENDGYVEVRANQLFIIDPQKGGNYATLLPNPALDIFVNDKKITSETVVTTRDEVRAFRKRTRKKYNIIVSDDGLEVFLVLNKELFKTYKLKNKPRSTNFTIEIIPYPHDINVEEVSMEITKELFKKGISVDIDISAVYQELINPTFEKVKIAKGLPVIPPVDSVLEMYFSNELEEVIEEVDGKIDFKNRIKIPHVTPGEIVAKLFPPKEGQEGYNVYGKTLKPTAPKKLEVRPKQRVKVSDKGEFVAIRSGRPTITGTVIKYIDILKTHEVKGDVDMSTGNIFFHGDVIVNGNVLDGMKVEASGNIIILGNVYHAQVIATQDIKIKGIAVNSTIIAGQLSIFYSELYSKAQNLIAHFNKIKEALNILEHKTKVRNITFNFNQALLKLIDMKFNTVIKEVNDILSLFNDLKEAENNINFKLKIMQRTINPFKTYAGIKNVHSYEVLNNIIFCLNDFITEIESMMMTDSGIQLHGANLSTIKTNGDIVITKDGTVQSYLFAGSNIIFNKPNSSVRGGKLEAVKNISAGIIGTEIGAIPEIYAGESIEIQKINHANLKMPYYQSFLEDHQKLKLVFDEEKEQVVYSAL